MKSREFTKKINLGKQTVSNLENKDMNEAKGGFRPTLPPTQCPTVWYRTCDC